VVVVVFVTVFIAWFLSDLNNIIIVRDDLTLELLAGLMFSSLLPFVFEECNIANRFTNNNNSERAWEDIIEKGKHNIRLYNCHSKLMIALFLVIPFLFTDPKYCIYCNVTVLTLLLIVIAEFLTLYRVNPKITACRRAVKVTHRGQLKVTHP